MRVLVTGAAGFIGSHLCGALLSRGYKVSGMDDLSKGRLEWLKDYEENPNFDFIIGSIEEEILLAKLIKNVDIIYHLAAVVGVKNYVEDPVKVMEVNLCYTVRLLELSWQMNKKIVFSSTSEVYGKNDNLPFQEESDRVYGSAHLDRWCYAVSKTAAEHLCYSYSRRGLPVVILRYFNVYGPRADSSDYGGVATIFMKQALAGESLTVHGDGSQTRCFTYVNDIVTGTIEAGFRPKAEGKTFNLGSTKEVSILELAEKIRKLGGNRSEVVFQPYFEFYGPHYEDIPRRVPNLNAAEQVLDYHPKVALEEGLKKTYEWTEARQHRILKELY